MGILELFKLFEQTFKQRSNKNKWVKNSPIERSMLFDVMYCTQEIVTKWTVTKWTFYIKLESYYEFPVLMLQIFVFLPRYHISFTFVCFHGEKKLFFVPQNSVTKWTFKLDEQGWGIFKTLLKPDPNYSPRSLA